LEIKNLAFVNLDKGFAHMRKNIKNGLAAEGTNAGVAPASQKS